jgi:hypothetical protein
MTKRITITDEQYWGLQQVIDTKINSLTNIITERAAEGKTTATHGKSLAFYRRLKTTMNKAKSQDNS